MLGMHARDDELLFPCHEERKVCATSMLIRIFECVFVEFIESLAWLQVSTYGVGVLGSLNSKVWSSSTLSDLRTMYLAEAHKFLGQSDLVLVYAR